MSQQSSAKINPFPQLAVASGSLAGLPSYNSSSLEAARKLIDVWQEGLATAPGLKGDPSATSPGLVMSIRGRFGSGKTHLVLQVMQEFDKITAKWSPASRLVSKQMYIQPDTLEPEPLYKNEIAGRLTDNELQDLVARHVQLLVAEKTSDAEPGSLGKVASERIVTTQISQPRYVLDLLQANLLPVSGVEQGVRDRFESVRSDVNRVETAAALSEDYSRAYSRIIDVSLGAKARDWIRGQPLTAKEASSLSISLPVIQGKADSQAALEFLLRAYRKAGCLLLLCLDEIERFVMTGGESRRTDQLTLLKTLVEVVTATGHCIVVSGSEDAWEAVRYRRDVTGRFPESTSIQVVLGIDECRQLLSKYCESAHTELSAVFAKGAITALVEAGEFTARRILTLAHDAFIEAKGELISVGLIETLSVRGDVLKRWSDAAREAEKAIREEVELRGMAIQAGFTYSDQQFDFAISDQKRLRLLVQITKTAYRVDEAAAARATATVARSFSVAGPQPKLCLVLIGYSNEGVRAELARTVDKVMLYNQQTFRPEFKALLNDLNGDSHGDSLPVKPETFQEVDKNLGNIGQQAGADIQKLNDDVAAMNASKSAGYDRERQIRIAERFDAILLDLRDSIRQPQLADSTPATAPDPKEQIRILKELNRLLPDEYRIGRLLNAAANFILATPRETSASLFVLGEIVRLHAGRVAALKPNFFRNWIYRFGHMPWPSQAVLAGTLSILLALGLWIFFSLPDATEYTSYKTSLAPLFKLLTEENPNSRSDINAQKRAIEVAAWQAGIARDQAFLDLNSALTKLVDDWSYRQGHYSSNALADLERARSANRLSVALGADLHNAVFDALLVCLAICLLYPVYPLMERSRQQRVYKLD